MEKKERNKRRKRGDKREKAKGRSGEKHTLLVWIETVSQQSDFYLFWFHFRFEIRKLKLKGFWTKHFHKGNSIKLLFIFHHCQQTKYQAIRYQYLGKSPAPKLRDVTWHQPSFYSKEYAPCLEQYCDIAIKRSYIDFQAVFIKHYWTCYILPLQVSLFKIKKPEPTLVKSQISPVPWR